MTEDKENCNFQQNYNVFGLDDKPCCYLYHKYCDEIDNCYFKRCKCLEQENKELRKTNEISIEKVTVTAEAKRLQELEQENKELKSRVNGQWKLLEQCGINSGGELRRAGYIINDFVQLSNKYRSALEEIKNDLKEVCKEECDYTKSKFCGDCDRRYGQILTKINEVLQ